MGNNGLPDRPGFWIGQQPTLALVVQHIAAGLEGRHRFFVEAAAAGSVVSLECETLLDPLKSFSSEVRAMYETLKGTADLNFTGSQLHVRATIDKHGHVFWAVNLRASHADPPFTFIIEEDQTLLWNVTAKIEDLLSAITPEARFG